MTINTVQNYEDEIRRYVHDISQVKVPERLQYKLLQLSCSHQLMFERFCPFKVGQTVYLTNDCNRWTGREHFMKKGAAAIVKVRDFNIEDAKFLFYVEFVDETYKYQGQYHKVESKGLYSFGEDWLTIQNSRL